APILVGPDVLAGLAHHHRGLRALNERPSRIAWRMVGNAGGNAFDGIAVVERFLQVGGYIGIVRSRVLDCEHGVFLVGALLKVTGQRKFESGTKGAAIGLGAQRLESDFLLLQAKASVPAALVTDGIFAGILVELALAAGVEIGLDGSFRLFE